MSTKRDQLLIPVLVLASIICGGVGMWMIWPPLAWLWAGSWFFASAYVINEDRKKRQTEPPAKAPTGENQEEHTA